MTPQQLDVLAGLHRRTRETITVARAYGQPGSILVTLWLIGGKSREVVITSEGAVSNA